MDLLNTTTTFTKYSPETSFGNGPNLIEESAKFYLENTLKKCKDARIRMHSVYFNVVVLFVFFFIVGAFLYYRYYSKPTREETNYRIMKDQEFILSKIRYFQEQQEQINKNASPITGLPGLSDSPETRVPDIF